MRSVELFAGAGGLAIGMSNAGFFHDAVVEWNHDACETFRANQILHTSLVGKWPLFEMDIRKFSYSTIVNEIAVVSGGPPCQPFSMGGKHRGFMDSRNMFPEAVRAIRELHPKAFIFENVKGLLRDTFAQYFEYIILQLSHPGIVQDRNEDWRDHLSRLEQHHTSCQGRSEYNVVFRLLNAADYGVPQKRERVFIVGFRSDLGIEWSFPEPSNTEAALLYSQWISGEYWERHHMTKNQRPSINPRHIERIARLRRLCFTPHEKPWVTVREAIGDLPDPERSLEHKIPNHIFNPGAKVYPGHTGSPLDEPAKTLKAGSHGVPGGENMLTRIDGSVRYFTVREAARLQTFPDDFIFIGAWSEAMRQLGNAVPVKLAQVVAASIAEKLNNLK